MVPPIAQLQTSLYKLHVTHNPLDHSDKGLTLETSAPHLLPYDGINYLINSLDYPNLLCENCKAYFLSNNQTNLVLNI